MLIIGRGLEKGRTTMEESSASAKSGRNLQPSMNRLAALSASVSLAVLMVPSVIAPSEASPFTGGTTGWTIIGQPSVVTLNGYPTAKVNYQNNINVTIALGVVYLVLHNGMGQTLYIKVGTTSNVPSSTNSTAFVVLYNVPSGTYSATFFATLPSGTAMSLPTSVSITF